LAETERKKAFQNTAIFRVRGVCARVRERPMRRVFCSENMLALADFGVQFQNKQEYFYMTFTNSN
jgi:hypothetical protein